MINDVCARVRERMERLGFPGSLLPENMVSERYDESSGFFEVRLDAKVSFKVEGIGVKYDTTITGTIVQEKITQLKGVKAKQTFWFPISAILVEAPDLVFKVGPVRKAIPRSAFL